MPSAKAIVGACRQSATRQVANPVVFMMVFYFDRNANAARLSEYNRFLKHNRLVQLSALRTARAVHVRVVGIDGAAFLAAENPVLGVRWPEAAAAHFGINPPTAQRAERQRHVNLDEVVNAHGAFVSANGTVCQLKISSPNIGRDDGAKRRLRAMASAFVSPLSARPSVSMAFSEGSRMAETTLPSASTSACTLLGASTSLNGSDGRWISFSFSSRRCASSPEICSVEFSANANGSDRTGLLNSGSGLKSSGGAANGFVCINRVKTAPRSSRAGACSSPGGSVQRNDGCGATGAWRQATDAKSFAWGKTNSVGSSSAINSLVSSASMICGTFVTARGSGNFFSPSAKMRATCAAKTSATSVSHRCVDQPPLGGSRLGGASGAAWARAGGRASPRPSGWGVGVGRPARQPPLC